MGGEREAGRQRKGKSRRTDDVKISSRVCDREIETAREGEIVLKAETTQPERKREGWVGGVAIKRVIARHRGKHLFKFPPEVSYGCKCCGRLLGGKAPWAPYLKGTFRSTILICPSIPSENNFKR